MATEAKRLTFGMLHQESDALHEYARTSLGALSGSMKASNKGHDIEALTHE